MTRRQAITGVILMFILFCGTARADHILEGTLGIKDLIVRDMVVVDNPGLEEDYIYVLGDRKEDPTSIFVRKYTDRGKHLWSAPIDFNYFYEDLKVGPFLHRFNTIHVNANGDKIYVAGYLLDRAGESSLADRKCKYAEAIISAEDGKLIDRRILGITFDYIASTSAVTDVYYAADDMVYFARTEMQDNMNTLSINTLSMVSGFGQGFLRFSALKQGAVQAVRKYGDTVYTVGRWADIPHKFFISRYESGVFSGSQTHFAANKFYPDYPMIEDMQIDETGIYIAITSSDALCYQYKDKGWTNFACDDTIRTYCDQIWISLHRLNHDLSHVWSRDTVVENPGYEWVFNRLIDLTETTTIINTNINLDRPGVYLTGTVTTTTIRTWETTFNTYLIHYTREGKRKLQQFFSKANPYQYNPSSRTYLRKSDDPALPDKLALLMAVERRGGSKIRIFWLPKIITVDISYSTGWNLFSIPVDAEYSPSDFNFSIIYEYKSGAGFDHVLAWETLKPGHAYWGLAKKPFLFQYKGNEILSMFLYPAGFDEHHNNCTWIPETERYDCKNRKLFWFTLGSCSYPFEYIGYPDGAPIVVYEWDKAKGGYIRPTKLIPGKGYWTAWDTDAVDLPIELKVKQK